MGVPKLKRVQKIAGGEVVCRILAAEGVDAAFGIIDGTYFGLYSNFEAHGIKLVTPRHETVAANMAGAYARATGRLGVCIASNGPGVANILPGVAVENAEGNRVLLITSCRREGIAYPDRGGTFQCFDHVSVIRPMSKWSETVTSVDRLAELTRRALKACWSGRPGVVHLDVPESILNGSYEIDERWFWPAKSYRNSTPINPAPSQVDEALAMIDAAKQPMIHIGSGAIHGNAGEAIMDLAARIGAPITTSWGARCALDERRREVIPMLQVDAVNRARSEADLVLCVGSRLGETDWWGKAPYWGKPEDQQLIHVDIDDSVLGTTRPADLAVLADGRLFANALLEKLGYTPKSVPAARRKWLNELHRDMKARRKKLDKHLNDMSVPMDPAHVPAVCRHAFDDNSILVIDGGNTSIWANFFHESRVPGKILGTPKMGMLGAGVGQALGAAVAFPDRQVYCIIGDGAMGMQQQEIETAVRNNINVIFLVLCDKQWGMVKINQQFALKPIKTLVKKSLSPDETINADLDETRFDDLARAMGAHGERVADPAGLRGAIDRCRTVGGCSVIHVDVDPVKHMWGAQSEDLQGHACRAGGLSCGEPTQSGGRRRQRHQRVDTADRNQFKQSQSYAMSKQTTSDSPRAVLVTGAAGYIGRLVLAALADNPGTIERIVATDLRTTNIECADNVVAVAADLQTSAVVDLIAEHRVDTVVHLAAVVTPPKGSGRELAYAVDVEGTRRLLEGCLAHNVRHFVTTSSGAAYGYHPDNPALLREDDKLRGNEAFAYAHHKRLVEQQLAELRVSNPELQQLILRPGTILGAEANNQITGLFERPVVLGLREADSPFVFVHDEDVAEVIAIGVQEQREGIYNLVGDGVMTLREVAAAMGRRFVGVPVAWLRGALSALDRVGAAPYSPDQVLFLLHRPVMSNRRLKREFGYIPKSSREAFEIYRAAHQHDPVIELPNPARALRELLA